MGACSRLRGAASYQLGTRWHNIGGRLTAVRSCEAYGEVDAELAIAICDQIRNARFVGLTSRAICVLGYTIYWEAITRVECYHDADTMWRQERPSLCGSHVHDNRA